MTPLDAIRAAPDDDAPRLAYASHVGGGLGELIRAQCALARLPRRHASRAAQEAEESRLFGAHGGEVAWPGVGERAVGLSRGFVEHIVMDARSFVARGAALADTLVRSVRLERVHGVLDDVLGCPWLVRVESLDLGGAYLSNLDAEKVASCPSLSHVRNLDLSRNDLDDRGVEAIAGSRVLALARLALSGNIVGDEGLAALAVGRACVSLRDLGLAREAVSSAGFGIVVRARSLEALRRLPLRRLVLRGNALDEEAASVLAEGFDQLEELDLGGCRLGPRAVAALVASPSLPREITLDVRDAGIDADGLVRLASRFAEVVS